MNIFPASSIWISLETMSHSISVSLVPMQDTKNVVVDEVCVPKVVRALDVSTPYSTFLEVIVMDYFLYLLFNLGVDGESINSLWQGWFASIVSTRA